METEEECRKVSGEKTADQVRAGVVVAGRQRKRGRQRVIPVPVCMGQRRVRFVQRVAVQCIRKDLTE